MLFQKLVYFLLQCVIKWRYSEINDDIEFYITRTPYTPAYTKRAALRSVNFLQKSNRIPPAEFIFSGVFSLHTSKERRSHDRQYRKNF